MANEKMMILKMLEEGKINAEDAAKLLASADTPPLPMGGTGAGSQMPPRPASGGSVPSGSSIDSAPRPNSAAPPKTGSAVDEMGKKFGAFMKDMEPKLKKAAETVVVKTASAADSISKSLSAHGEKRSASGSGSGTYFPQAPTPTRPAKSSSGAGIEEMIEILVRENGAELNLSGLNGQVLVKGYNGDKISAKIYTVAKRAGAKAELAVLGNKYYLAYDENDFERVCIDAFVPESMFDNVRIATVNGDIRAATLTANFVQIESMNGGTEVAEVSAQNIVIESNNGGLILKDSAAHTATIENFNGGISIHKIDIANLKATTFNGAVDMQIAGFTAYDHYNWHVETSNGKLGVVLPSYSTLGYHVKAHAALGDVKLGLVGMNYLRNDKSFVEAKSIGYDEALKKVDMTLATSGASLVVN
ncbi:MAG: DUF4097 family beta strand repeat-containing protein [Defluviitaleaceae bacterium]|nr:DUF4097 family beta strand repeat-containing protein [Defluviitaleaceae bacterium]